MSTTWMMINLPLFRAGYSIKRNRRSYRCLSKWKVRATVREEEIVIVGAGIAGLATAVSLNRQSSRS